MNHFVFKINEREVIDREICFIKRLPQNLDEIFGNSNIIDSFKYYLENNNIPNLLLVGPNGIGKYSSVNCLVKEYLKDDYKQGCLIIHGSINRGKDVVSEKMDQKKNTEKNYDGSNIINFIKKKVQLNDKKKIIIIVDYDHMTKESQMALRRIIELYSTKTRFILMATELSKVIEAIQSRTVLFKYNSLDNDALNSYIDYICKKDNIEISESIKTLVIYYSGSDLRQILINLHVLKYMKNKSIESFYNFFNFPKLIVIENIIQLCLHKKTSQVYKLVSEFINEGYQIQEIIDYIFKYVYLNRNNLLTTTEQYNFLNIIIKFYFKIENLSTSLQLFSLIYWLINLN